MSVKQLEGSVLWIIKIGLWVIPFLPLYVSSSMLFPFITGKNFAFRIITEIIFALWVGLAVANPAYRPRLSPLVKVVTVFIAILFLADIFSPNPYRAFFSNYERMEGFLMLFHLYLYFLMLSSVFKTGRDWMIFFHSTLIASLAVSYVALLQKFGYRVSLQGGFRVDSTIGNPTYLAAYLLFHVWLLLLLLQRFWKKWWLTIIYALALLFELLIIYFTATRGAVLALLAVGILFLAAVIVFWHKAFLVPSNVQTKSGLSRLGLDIFYGRKIAAAALLLIILTPIAFWQLRETDFIRSNEVLQRLTNYSLNEGTIQSRFKIWGMSAQAALERPIRGWGQENYYLVFQKYYHPGLYGDEPWFDRSHNVIFDWLIQAGFLGLLSYLSIIGAALAGIVSAVRKNTLGLWTGLILASVFITHFLQNLFVFDNLNTYLLFFAFLAYTEYSLASNFRRPDFPESRGVRKSDLTSNYIRACAVSAALLLAVSVGGYFLHVKPVKEGRALIRALIIYKSSAPMEQLIAAFERALSYRTFGDMETREQMANIAREVTTGESRFSPEEKRRFVEFTVEELKKETAGPAKNVRELLFLSSVMTRSLSLNSGYAAESEKILQEALALSPKKQILYFELAQLYLITGNTERAAEVLKRAWDLERNFREAGANLLTVAVIAKREDLIEEVKKEISFPKFDQPSLNRIASAYQRVENFAPMLEIYDILVERNPRNPKYRATRAALLANFGRIEEARREAEEAARLDPAFKKEAKQFMEMLKQQSP